MGFTPHAVLRRVIGNLLGLDANDDLVIGGKRIWYGNSSSIGVQGSVDLSTIAGGGSGGSFSNSITPAQMVATVDDYAPTGYVAGTTNRMLLTPASGGTTLNGLLAAPDGWAVLLVNTSGADSILVGHLASDTAVNEFNCSEGQSQLIGPLSSALVVYIANKWWFAS